MGRRVSACLCVFILLPILVLPSLSATAEAFTPDSNATFLASQPSDVDRKTIEKKFDLLPLKFEPNRGQSSSDAEFLAEGRSFSALFKRNEADLLLSNQSSTANLVRVMLLDASEKSAIAGENQLPGTVNYLIGNDPKKWRTGLPTFGLLRYSDVYPGTDLVYYGSHGRLEFDFQLSPTADPEAIRMRFEGARCLKIDRNGGLTVMTSEGRISFQKPVLYQPTEGDGKDLVAGSFEIIEENTIGFSVAKYDRSRPLIIDPILNYSTYIGPLANASSIAVDQNGEAYVTGIAYLGFPTTPGSYQPVGVKSSAGNTWPGGGKPFVAKFNSTGTALLYSTFLSGSGVDWASGIALDGNGDAFVVGSTSSTDFPITTGALQTENNASEYAGFVAELSSTGSSLLYSTYLGGSTWTSINQVAVDPSGNAYLTGRTEDTNFPTTPNAYRTTAAAKATAGSNSAFITKLNPAGTELVYSTYLGGSGADESLAIAVDGAGEAYVGGNTTSSDFPTTPGALQGVREANNGQAGFVTKLNASGSALTYSTYLSGEALDYINAITVDSNGNAYAAGSTNSPDFPVTAGAYQTTIANSGGFPQPNAFVSELNSAGTSLVYSTFLGGSIISNPNGDEATAIAIDGQGMVYLTGLTSTVDFPVTTGAFETHNLDIETIDESTAFLTKINPRPDAPLVYSTFLGGTGNGDGPEDFFTGEEATAVALDPTGNVYLAGSTISVDFPTTAGVIETPFNGPSEEAFVTEFNGSEMTALPIPTVTLTSNSGSVLFGQTVTFTATVQSANGSSTPTGYVGFNFLELEPSDNNGTGIGFGPWTTVPLNGSGVATFTTSSLDALQTPVNAFYLGDSNNAPATGTMTQTITDIPTVTTVTSSANNVPYGASIVFTATVLDNTGKPAKGYVFFVLGNISYANPDLDSAGQATWVNGTGGAALPVGTDTVKVEFFPYTGYQQSSGTLAETFTPLGTTPDPTLTPPAGSYTSAQEIAFGDSNPSAIVYYTWDGSTPVPGVSSGFPVGFGFTFPIDSSETINAIAVAPGYSPSNMVSAAYAINLPPPSFAIFASPTSLSIKSGQQGAVTLTVTPQSGFNSAISFACSGLAVGASCAFNPVTVTPAGAGGSTTLTITAQTLSATARSDRRPILPGATLAIAVSLLGWRRRHDLRLVLFVSAALVGLGLISSCAGGNGGSSGGAGVSTTPMASTVTVTATSGSEQQTAIVSLTVN